MKRGQTAEFSAIVALELEKFDRREYADRQRRDDKDAVHSVQTWS